MCSTLIPEILQPAISQGIQGQVTQLAGNYIPGNGVGRSSEQRNDRLQTKIWIFAGEISGTGSPRWSVEESTGHPSLKLQVESDCNGHYAAALLPGEYTVFVQQGNDLYLNAFQSNGNFKSVTVAANRVTKLDLINTENAFF